MWASAPRPRGSARPRRTRRARRACRERVALADRGRELAARAPCSSSSRRAASGSNGALLRERLEVALVDQRAREAAQRRALAPARRPRAGCRGRGRRSARRRRRRGARPATPPRPRRRARRPAPRRPCGSRAGRRTRAAAPAASGRRARGSSRRSRARAPRGRRRRARARRRQPLRGARALEPLAQPQLHGGGGVLGEGDRGDLLEPRGARADDGLDAVHEQRRLPGAGAGLEHEAGGVVAARALAGRVVGRPEGAQAMSRSRRYVEQRAGRGACSACRRCEQRPWARTRP